MKGLMLSAKEEKRAYVLNGVLAKDWTVREGAELLQVSERHLRRILARYRKEGVAALVHGNRGRVPANATPEEVRQRIVEQARGPYDGANYSHMSELLEERDGISCSRWTVRRVLQVLRAFLPKYNACFGVPAPQPGLAYHPIPGGLDPKSVLCLKHQRVVAPDNTVQSRGRTLQIPPTPRRVSYARARVEVQERLDGTIVVVHGGEVLATREAPPGPVTLRACKEPL